MLRSANFTSPLGKSLGFVDAVLVVTIEGEHERQEQTAHALQAHGVPFEFFYGADYRKCTIEELAAAQVYDPSFKQCNGQEVLTPGEIGCAVSHRKVAEKVVSGEYNRVLIVEDDLLVLDRHSEAFAECLPSLPTNWNLLYLGYNKNNLSIPLSTRLKLLSWYPLRFWLGSQRHNPDTIRRIFRRPLDAHWFHAGCFNGTHAYAIDRAAARYIVELQTPVKLEADKALQHLVRFSGLNAYCPRFDVFDQRWDIPSLVGPRASWQ